MGQSDVLNKQNSNETRNYSKLAAYSRRTKEIENHIELDILNAIKGTTVALRKGKATADTMRFQGERSCVE
jgi:hypothetical protein